MGSQSKTFALILVIIVAVSSVTLSIVKPVSAQSIPSIPQFSLSYVAGSIEVKIVNQPFSPNFINNITEGLYYDIRWKEHSANKWTYYYPNSYLFEASNSNSGDNSLSQVTVITYGLNRTHGVNLQGISAGSQVDFQVEALIGYYFAGFHYQVDEKFHFPFDGKTSGYSDTQTISIPASSSLPSQTPTVPEFSWLVALPLFASMLFIAVILRQRKSEASDGKNNQ